MERSDEFTAGYIECARAQAKRKPAMGNPRRGEPLFDVYYTLYSGDRTRVAGFSMTRSQAQAEIAELETKLEAKGHTPEFQIMPTGTNYRSSRAN